VRTQKEDKNRGASPSSQAPFGLIAAVLATLYYLPALQYGWVWDDSLLVAAKGSGGASTEGFRPAASLLYQFEWMLGFGHPGLFHLTSILLHGIATWLVFLLARRVGAASWLAFSAALLFGAHPVHAEAVAYVSGRPDLLATVFALASLLLATSAPVLAPGGSRNWRVWPAYGLLALAMLSEEVALATPFVLVLLDRVAEPPRPWRERRAVHAGFFGVLVLTLLVRLVQGRLSVGSHGEVPAGAEFTAPFVAAYDALRAFVIAWDMNALRAFPKSLAGLGAVVWRAALPLCLLALVAWWRRKDPLARAGVVLLAVTLVPALPLPFFQGSFLMERALYFPSVGFCFLVASVVGWLAERIPVPMPSRAGAVIAVLIVALLGLATLARVPVWRDNLTLLRAAAASDPKDAKPYVVLAEHYVALGDPAGALTALGRAIQIDSTDADTYYKQTAVLALLGRYPEAEDAARKSVALAPDSAIGWANLGDALTQQGKTSEAIVACRRAVALDSTGADNWYNLGVALSGERDLSEAIAAYRRVIALNPRHVQAINNMGALLGASGRIEEARDAYKQAVRLTPASVEVRMNLARAYLRLGDKAAAEEQRKVIQRLDPMAASRIPEILRGSATPGTGGDAPRRP